MVDVKTEIVNALSKCDLEVHYEMFTDKNTKYPCITYMEDNNSHLIGESDFNYNTVTFQIKVWSKSLEEISKTSLKIDTEMQNIGLKRTMSRELTYKGLICKIFKYKGLAYYYNKDYK